MRAHRLGEKVEELEREAAEQAAAAGAVDEKRRSPSLSDSSNRIAGSQHLSAKQRKKVRN